MSHFTCECPSSECREFFPDDAMWRAGRGIAIEHEGDDERLAIVLPEHVGTGRVVATGEGFAIVEYPPDKTD